MPAPKSDYNSNNLNASYSTSASSNVSRIAEGTIIKGEISSQNDFRLDGSFEGKIISKGRVILGETAVAKGDILGSNAELNGKIEGNIFVQDTLELKRGCLVDGNITTKRLVVELGSVFNGNCKMGGNLQPSAEPADEAVELPEE